MVDYANSRYLISLMPEQENRALGQRHDERDAAHAEHQVCPDDDAVRETPAEDVREKGPAAVEEDWTWNKALL